jgi:hypothetical protein
MFKGQRSSVYNSEMGDEGMKKPLLDIDNMDK